MMFDLDGTVVDNRLAIKQSYVHAGVTEFPKNWFYVGGWPTEEQRRRKMEVYEQYLARLSLITPVGKILLQTGGTVLSACSQGSLDVFLTVYPQFMRPDISLYCGFTQEDKLSYLRAFSGGIYFDDYQDTIQRAREIPGWAVIDASSL